MINMNLCLFILIILIVHAYGLEKKVSNVATSAIILLIGFLLLVSIQFYYINIMNCPIYLEETPILEVFIFLGGKILAYLFLLYGLIVLTLSTILFIIKKYLIGKNDLRS
ncbi:MAG: hypothetical protein GXZ08_08475 [Tissierellia bacterium]|nr:hypothetical protein [Tissierellia bacterium]